MSNIFKCCFAQKQKDLGPPFPADNPPELSEMAQKTTNAYRSSAIIVENKVYGNEVLDLKLSVSKLGDMPVNLSCSLSKETVIPE